MKVDSTVASRTVGSRVDTEVRLLRLLHGELPESQAAELRDRLGSDPELAAAYARLERAWQGLTLPEPSPVPLGWSGRVLARVRSEARSRETGAAAGWAVPTGLSLAKAPTWVRTTAAVALLVGVALGAGMGLRILPEEAATPISLTDSYRAMVGGGPPPGRAAALDRYEAPAPESQR